MTIIVRLKAPHIPSVCLVLTYSKKPLLEGLSGFSVYESW